MDIQLSMEELLGIAQQLALENKVLLMRLEETPAATHDDTCGCSPVNSIRALPLEIPDAPE